MSNDKGLLLRVIDFETTGFPPEAGIVEVGWTDVRYSFEMLGEERKVYTEVGEWESELTDPGRKIEIAAMAIHHIRNEDVSGKRKPEEVLRELQDEPDYFVAHNAKFEKEFFQPGKPWICTLKAGYRLCPKAPNHQNQTLRYFLNTPVPRDSVVHSHRAGPDACVTAYTLAKFLTAVTPEVLSRWESEPTHFPLCPIGATERGKPWHEVERSFLAWICRQPKMEPDIKQCAMRELDYRDGKRTRPGTANQA